MKLLLVLACVSSVCCLAPLPARAQSDAGSAGQSAPEGGGGRGGHWRHGRGAAASQRTQPDALSTLPPTRNAGQRLDVGAVLCESREELIARAERIVAQGAGQALLPEGCRPILASVPVTVVERVPPGSTEVRLASGELGWTDVWLPDTGPVDASRQPAATHPEPQIGPAAGG